MEINTQKTKTVIIASENTKPRIRLDGKLLQQVDGYLSTIIEENRKSRQRDTRGNTEDRKIDNAFLEKKKY